MPFAWLLLKIMAIFGGIKWNELALWQQELLLFFEKVEFEISATDHIADLFEFQAINLHYWKSNYNRIFLIMLIIKS